MVQIGPTKLIFSIFLSLIVSYFYVLNGDFLGDDIDRIAFNPELRSYWTALTGGLGDRPLLMLIITTLSKLSANNSVFFRLFSIAIHCLVSFQIFKFILELNRASPNTLKNQIAASCAFIFTLHPLHSQSITLSIQVGVILSGLFGLLSMRYYFKGISGLSDRNFIKSFLYFLLGVLAKPNLTFLPIYFLLNRNKIQGNKTKQAKVLLLYTSLLLIPVLFYAYAKKNVQSHTYSPFTYFLIQSEVLFTYFKLMIIPYGLKFLYDFSIPTDIWNSINWLYLAGHAFIITLAVWKLPSRLLVNLFLGFYISFLPESGFFPINHLAFEHRTYFPMIFLFLFIGSSIIHLNLDIQFRKLITIVTTGLCLGYIILNQNRNIDIKRYGTWALHTLNNSVMYDYHNFMFSFLLMRAGNFDKVEPLVNKYPILYKDKDYDILVDFFNYYKYPEKNSEYFDKFINHLDKRKLTKYSRLFLNKVLLEEYAQKYTNLEELYKIEDIVSKQLSILVPRESTYHGVLNNYIRLSSFLLSPDIVDKYKRYSYINYLKTKTNLVVYFDQKFVNLEKEIEIELQKNPDVEMLKNLLKGLKQKNTQSATNG